MLVNGVDARQVFLRDRARRELSRLYARLEGGDCNLIESRKVCQVGSKRALVCLVPLCSAAATAVPLSIPFCKKRRRLSPESLGEIPSSALPPAKVGRSSFASPLQRSNVPRQYTHHACNLPNGQHPISRPHPERGQVQDK